MDDDDYHYNQERKAQRMRVGFAIAGVLGAIVLIVVRFGLRKDMERAATPIYVPASSYIPPPAPLPVAREPIEFQLVAGTERLDVVPGERLTLPGGASIVVEQNPTWLTAGDGFHFKHRSSVSISPSADMIIASVDGVVAKLQAMDSKLSDAAAKKLLSSSIVDTGQTVGTPQPVQRTIAGKPRDGILHDTTTPMKVEIFLVPVGKLKLGVLIYRQDPNADLSKIEALLESVTEGTGEPMAEFTTKIGTDTVPLFLGKAQTLALDPPLSVTLERRATVLRTLTGNGGALTFEHPRGIAVSRMPNDQMLAVTIQTDRAAIQLFDLGMRFTVEELKNALVGQMAAQDLGDVTRTHGTTTMRGKKLRMANLPVDYELYIFERGGKTIGASIQYIPADEQHVVEVALPIFASVR